MALVNPSIALGVQPLQIADPLTQYGKIAAIKSAQNQNALAQYQLNAAQRADAASAVQNELMAKHFDPSKGAVNLNALIAEAAQRGQGGIIPSLLKTDLERQTAAATLAKTKAETEKNIYELQDKKLRFAWNAVGSAPTPEAAIAELTKGVKDGVFDMRSATEEIQRVRSLNPDQYRQYRIEKVMGILDAKDKLGFMLPKVTRQEAGGQILSIQDNPILPGYGQPIAGAAITKTPTIADRTAQGQLNLAQQKFQFEMANPGFELKEAEDGSIVGVNKRTLQAFPVSIGGVAPAAPGAGMPGPRMPSPATQAIPGMTSVLGQPAAAAPVAGTPLRGKGTALTESQGNATAYGMRMSDANSLLTELEKSGTTSGGRIKSAVQGTFTSLVPVLGERMAEGAGAVMNVLPGVMGGPSEAQQSYEQAKQNFITAVLRKESGAAIGADEFAREEKKYFPQAGEGDNIVKQKQRARERAIEAMKIQAGPGAKNIGAGGGVIPGATPNNPLGLPGF